MTNTKSLTIGFGLCGSYCTHQKALDTLADLVSQYQVIPLVSHQVAQTNTRFGTADALLQKLESLCGHKVIQTIPAAEPIGPQKQLDLLVIAPCTGNTLGKMASGIADTPITLAAKAHLRNGKPILIAPSTNDGLAVSAVNIGQLLGRKHIYFVPFGQDDPVEKPDSLVSDFGLMAQAIACALKGEQLQPVLLRG